MDQVFDSWTKREINFLVAIAVCLVLLISTLIYHLLTDRAHRADDHLPLPSVAEEGNREGSGLVTPKDEMEEIPAEIVVDVKGAVKEPGIYRLPSDSRVYEAIEAAGGATDEADTDQLNLADFLSDGMAIVVPVEGEELSEGGMQTAGSGSLGTAGKVNINRATEEELQTLSGIGPAKAAAIVRDREENGPFKTEDDLTRVSGIGEKTLENIREEITVK